MIALRKPFILTSVLFGLVGLAYYDDWKTAEEQRAENKRKSVFSLDVSHVDEIRIQQPQKDLDVSLVKTDGKWDLTQPIAKAADTDAISNFLTTVTEYKFEKVVAPNLDRASEFGLAEPLRTISLKTKDKTISLAIGDKAPLGYSVYFSDGHRILMGSQYLRTSTDKTVRDFRSKEVVRIDGLTLSKLSYKRDNRSIVRVKWVDGEVKVLEPKEIPLQSSSIQKLISELNKAKAQDFAIASGRSALAGWESANEAYEIRWETQDGIQHWLNVRKVAGRPWAQLDGGRDLLALTDEAWAATYKTLPDFRDRQFVSVRPEQLEAIVVDGQSFRKREDGVYVNEANEEVSRIKDLVFDLTYAKVEYFLDDELAIRQIQKSAPESEIVLQTAGDQKPIELRLFPNQDDASKMYVSSSDRKGLVSMSKRVFSKRREEPVGDVEVTGKLDNGDNG